MPFQLSILTCVLNAREDFECTAASLPAVLGAQIEWIVVDGGSTDGTADAARADPRVTRSISERDAGVYHAYNKALAMAAGRYVWFLNAGDIAAPGAIDLALQAVASGNVDPPPVHCFAIRMLHRGGVVWQPTPQRVRECMGVPTPGVLAPREALLALGGFDTSYRVAADFDLWLRLDLQGRHPFATQPHVLLSYQGGGLSARLSHLAIAEEIAIQLRRMPERADTWLLRAVRYGVANIDPRTAPSRRWAAALRLARRFLY